MKNLRNQAKDLLKEIQDRYFSESLEEILEHLKKAGEPVGVLVDLTLRFMECYREKKRKRTSWILRIWSTMPWKFWYITHQRR